MKITLKLVAFFVAVCASAPAQVAPAATGGGGLPVPRNLDYAFRYSQTAQFLNGYTYQAATPSASVSYANGKERKPFSIEYTGGYIATISGPDYGSGFIQRMLLAQGFVWHRWNVHFSDDISYLPQAPTTGFSGIPGTGEPIGTNPTTSSSQTILTVNTHVANNMVQGGVDHLLNYATTLSAGGSYEILRYPDGNGLDTNSVGANLGLNRRLNARNWLSANYSYYDYTYPDNTVTFRNDIVLVGYRRQWTRNLTTDLSAGPQWMKSNQSSVVPSTTSVAALASLAYRFRFASADLNYHHGTNGGAGYLLGAEYDTVSATFSKAFGQDLSVGLTTGYQRTSSLDSSSTFDAEYGGVEATKRFGRNMIVFANYTGTNQSTNAALSSSALNQPTHVIGFGFGYSPRNKHFKQ